MMIEEAYNGILQSGIVAIVLMAGCILMYRHFSKEVAELKEIIKDKDKELSVIIKENIALQTRILDALNHLRNVIN